MAQVRLANLSKRFGQTEAVRSVDLEVEDHEFLVLVGPSGCGKTTILRMIAGLEEPTTGDIHIGDRRVNELSPKDRDIAMVFQNYALYPHMTVYENMAFGLKLRKTPKVEIDERVRQAADMLGLQDLLDRRPKALSGGQRQRVAMGRAIVRKPALFLFDEPLSNLDAKMRVEMRKEILRLHRNIKATMIYVTHDQVEAMTLGDRIVVMRDGLIEQVDDPESVFDNPATLFVARFIGSPPMNIFEGELKGEAGVTFDGATFSAKLPDAKAKAVESNTGQKAYLGIRPKAFVLKQRAAETGATASIKAKVDVTEMLGEEMLVHLIAGDHRFQVSIDPHDREHLKEEVEVFPLLDQAHVFDGGSEKNLTMP